MEASVHRIFRVIFVERDSVIEFYIRVTDSGEPALEDSALVTVTFTSEAFPVFRTGSSQMFLEESEPVGTEVTQVSEVLLCHAHASH